MTPRELPFPIRTVLLIDDEEAILGPLAHYFRRIGCRPVLAREREEAEALLEHQQFDLAILDLALGPCGLTGLEILRWMRERGDHTPVIVLSGHVGPDQDEAAKEYGADAVLEKPLALADLAQVCSRVAGGRRG